jgi:uncharacterized protein (TIGR03435 family)
LPNQGSSTLSKATAPTNLQTALQQLGLKLEPHIGPVDLLIIDQAERPPETTLP